MTLNYRPTTRGMPRSLDPDPEPRQPSTWAPTSDEERRIFRVWKGFTLAERSKDTLSWVWNYGVEIQSKTSRRWICMPCVRQKSVWLTDRPSDRPSSNRRPTDRQISSDRQTRAAGRIGCSRLVWTRHVYVTRRVCLSEFSCHASLSEPLSICAALSCLRPELRATCRQHRSLLHLAHLPSRLMTILKARPPHARLQLTRQMHHHANLKSIGRISGTVANDLWAPKRGPVTGGSSAPRSKSRGYTDMAPIWVRYWLCRICHVKKSYSTALYVSSGTSHAARHLLRQHQITEAGESDPSLATPFTLAATSGSSLSRLLSQQASLGLQLASHFDGGTWKARFVDWIIVEDITFRQASSERLRRLIENGGELASQLLPEHHTTVCSWIRQTFESRRQIIANLVKNATSSVHLSFDLWTASNGFNYVGIVGHFR